MPATITEAPSAEAHARAAPPDGGILEDLLRQVLLERSGDELLATLGRLHRAAARRGECGAEEELAALVADLDADSALPLARACTMHLAMANVADDLRRLQERRAADREDGEPPPMSLAEAARLVERTGKSPDPDIRLVLTAHPTDMSRRSVLTKHRTVARSLDALGDPRLGATERRRLQDDIREALAVWYSTNEVRAMRPRVADEVRRLLFFFETVLFDAAADLAGRYHRTVAAPEGSVTAPPLVFGSWAGGDMDGNPNVGPATIRDTLRAHRVDGEFKDDPLFHVGYGEPDHRDSAPVMPKGVVVNDLYDWEDDAPPRTPWGNTVIYEAHVKGLTYLHPSIPKEMRGTYKALGHPTMVAYLRRSGFDVARTDYAADHLHVSYVATPGEVDAAAVPSDALVHELFREVRFVQNTRRP